MNTQQIFGTIQAFVDKNGGQRLVVGIALFLCLQLGMLFNWLSLQTEEGAIELAALREEVLGMKAMLSADDLESVRAEAERLNEEFAKRSHRSETAGLAAADIQGQLTKIAKRSDVKDLEVVVNVDGDDDAAIIRLIVDISGVEQSPGAFALFLATIMKSEVEYDAEMIFWEQNSGRFKMRLASVGSFVED